MEAMGMAFISWHHLPNHPSYEASHQCTSHHGNSPVAYHPFLFIVVGTVVLCHMNDEGFTGKLPPKTKSIFVYP
jgi:hypothetical protein